MTLMIGFYIWQLLDRRVWCNVIQ